MKIKVFQPKTINNTEFVSIKLETDTNNSAIVNIDFSTLKQFIGGVSTNTKDFFTLSAAVYGIDRILQRRKNSVDGWSREIQVLLPVFNEKEWECARGNLEELLSFLTGDYWLVKFYKSDNKYPSEKLDNSYKQEYSQVNLLSGGLDSMIGAVDVLESKLNGKVIFVSHYDPHMHGAKGDQIQVVEKLKEAYPEKFTHIPSISVSLDNSTLPKETTLRSRSILFVGLALLVAENLDKRIILPENGTVSLNYPLSSSRRSSCSTRTTHPKVLELLKTLFQMIDIKTEISNPYEFYTKGEMVTKCKNINVIKNTLKYSNSCGKRGHRSHWDYPMASHCGICMPCIYRRAALLNYEDATTYGNAINNLIPFETMKGRDVGACLEYLKSEVSKDNVVQELIINGITNADEIDKYADVVLRAKNEMKELIKSIGNKMVKSKAGIL